jgi:uncharacterized membrane protein
VIRRLRGDEGSILPLVAFFGALALAVILLASAASSLYLERKRLFTLADDAALVGAEAFDVDSVPIVDGHPRPELRASDVSAAVEAYVAGTDTDEFESLHVEQATTADAESATVRLSAFWRPPVVTLFVPRGLRIDVTASARAVFG